MADRSEYFKNYRKAHRGQMNEASRISIAKRRGTSVNDIDERRELRQKYGEHYCVVLGLIPQEKRYAKKGWSK